uniref:RxLR effector protein n=1 Tax=Phytophthora sojae TaxID=67593 RepID=G1FRD4_PHYSO|nr:Avh107 [Phytophthora sojae]
MRLYCVVLMAIAALTASAESAATTDRKLITASKLETRQSNGERFLRTSKLTADQDDEDSDEERVFGLKLKSANAEQIKDWLLFRNSADDIFTYLKLDAGVDKVLSSKHFPLWREYVGVLNKGESPEKAIIPILVNKYKAESVAEMLQAAKKGWATKNMATKLEHAQFETWFKQEVRSSGVYKKVFGGRINVVTERAKDEYRAFLNKYHPEWFDVLVKPHMARRTT